jgi:hypothetical protein
VTARRALLVIASVIALLAVGAMPATSRAETGPHWFSEGQLLSGEPFSVRGRGFIEFEPLSPAFYECRIKDSEILSNPPGGGAGTDEIVAVKIQVCSEPRERGFGFCGSLRLQVIPLGLPWHSHLAFGSSNQVNDVFEGVALELRCKKGADKGIFASTLSGRFEGPNLWLSGTLSNGSEPMMGVQGLEGLKGPPGHKKITAA